MRATANSNSDFPKMVILEISKFIFLYISFSIIMKLDLAVFGVH